MAQPNINSKTGQLIKQSLKRTTSLGWLQPTYCLPMTVDTQHHDSEHTGTGLLILCVMISVYRRITLLNQNPIECQIHQTSKLDN